jgi:hypothetical protein
LKSSPVLKVQRPAAHLGALNIPAIYFDFLSARIFMISKCYFESEGESERLDLPFFIEFYLTSGFLIR